MGGGGTVLRTSNGGDSWQLEDAGTTSVLWAVSAPATGFAYAGGTLSTMRAYYDDTVPARVEVGAPMPGTITVGQQVFFTATARTAGGQRASGFSGPATIASTDPEAVLPSNPAFANGSGSFEATLRNAGSRRFTVGASGATPGESSPVTVNRATPVVMTTSVPSSTVLGGGEIRLEVELSGRVNPGLSTVQISLFGPSDPTCTGTPLQTESLPLASTATEVESDGYEPSLPGIYRWTAIYAGDANNNGRSSDCLPQTTVAKATPSVVLTPSSGGPVGSAVIASATVDDRFDPETSAVRFDLYGPADPDCNESPLFSHTADYPVGGGPVGSTVTTPTAPGLYRWVATYAGDANNETVSTACGAPGSTVLLDKAVPTLTTEAQPDVVVGSEVRGGAQLDGGFAPTGTLELSLHGPGDPDCTGTPLFTDTVAVDGTGGYESAPLEVERAGTYRWSSHYSGDAANESATRGCADGPGPFEVLKAESSTELTATPAEASEGAPVELRARVAGYRPGGEVVFRLGANELGRSTLDAAGEATLSAGALPLGAHSITARYQGDANNEPSDSAAASVTIRALPLPQPPPPPPAPFVRIQHSPNKPHKPNPKGGPRYSFRFADDAPGVTFYCRLDRRPFRVCTSPTVYRNLKRGRHVFRVKSLDAAGRWSPVRTIRFTVGKRRG